MYITLEYMFCAYNCGIAVFPYWVPTVAVIADLTVSRDLFLVYCIFITVRFVIVDLLEERCFN